MDNILLVIRKIIVSFDNYSEDIDLAIDREVFALEGDLTKKELKKLRKSSSLFVRDVVCPALLKALKDYALSDWFEVEAEPDGVGDSTYPEPRKIYIRYKSLFEQSALYLRPEIVLEIGSRSLIEPTETAKVKTFIAQHFPFNTD
ncbi:nucleotidyl transferase AbiEii/AbiGii toxin family protein, partial [Bacteroides heparinolyticus]